MLALLPQKWTPSSSPSGFQTNHVERPALFFARLDWNWLLEIFPDFKKKIPNFFESWHLHSGFATLTSSNSDWCIKRIYLHFQFERYSFEVQIALGWSYTLLTDLSEQWKIRIVWLLSFCCWRGEISSFESTFHSACLNYLTTPRKILFLLYLKDERS